MKPLHRMGANCDLHANGREGDDAGHVYALHSAPARKRAMTIHIVTTGVWDDYRVAGVFSSPEKAQPYADYLIAKGESNTRIEPLEVDSQQPRLLKTQYCFHFRKGNGQLEEDHKQVEVDYFLEDDGEYFYSYESAEDARNKAEKGSLDFLRENPERAWEWSADRGTSSELMTC